ncbi:MAG: hypothetical protein ACEY3F_03915, partial [Wolbachia sp.]
KPAKPLKIFYLQNEMEYDYIRERLQKLRISKKTLDAGTENLVITQKIKLTLNVEEIKEIMSENLDVKTVDLIVIDSLFDYRSMISFLQNSIDELRSIYGWSNSYTLHKKSVNNHVKKESISSIEWC